MEALSADQLSNEKRRIAILGHWLLGAMVWLGRASLKPCSGKLCFCGFRAALLHVEALSADQLMKASWSCGLAGPGFLETMLWQALFWWISGGPSACGGAFDRPFNEKRKMAMLELCPPCSVFFWFWNRTRKGA